MEKMSIHTLLLLLVSVSIFISPCLSIDTARSKRNCNLYQGKWVIDQTYPLFNSSDCPYLTKDFDCLKYGRPDQQYLKYRWQPSGCNVPRFNGVQFLSKMRGKKIMFVGDSVSDNNWQSFLCLLHAAVGGKNVVKREPGLVSSVTFKEYGVTVSLHLTHYLVDVQTTKIGKVMNLDEIRNGGNIWMQQDVLIFNTWLWWYRADSRKGWDYISNDRKIVKDMDRMAAYKKALTTWANWVNMNLTPAKHTVLFQGTPPQHYQRNILYIQKYVYDSAHDFSGKEWDEPSVTSCEKETTPFNGTSYPGGEPLALKVLKQVLGTTRQVKLFDITTLSQYRKDGHPSRYNGLHRKDCTHWCVAGVPDTWSQLLYAELV